MGPCVFKEKSNLALLFIRNFWFLRIKDRTSQLNHNPFQLFLRLLNKPIINTTIPTPAPVSCFQPMTAKSSPIPITSAPRETAKMSSPPMIIIVDIDCFDINYFVLSNIFRYCMLIKL